MDDGRPFQPGDFILGVESNYIINLLYQVVELRTKGAIRVTEFGRVGGPWIAYERDFRKATTEEVSAFVTRRIENKGYRWNTCEVCEGRALRGCPGCRGLGTVWTE